MTTDARVLDFSTRTDALFQAWGSGVASSLQAVGLVKTTDTGQIDWTTASISTASAAFTFVVGYEIYQFTDSLQATAPVIMKIEYGVMIAAPTNAGTYFPGHPVMYITVGTATNGAGALSGTLITDRTQLMGHWGSNANVANVADGGLTTGSSQIYSFGDGSSVVFTVGAQATAQPLIHHVSASSPMPLPCFFVVERSRNSGGAPTGDGVALFVLRWMPIGSYGSTHPSGPSPTSQFLSFTGATVSAQSILWPVDWPSNAWGTGVFGPDIYTYPLRMVTPKPMYGMSVLGTYKGDFSLGSLVTLTNLGVLHTYRSLAGIAGSASNDNARSYINPTIASGAILMRWE